MNILTTSLIYTSPIFRKEKDIKGGIIVENDTTTTRLIAWHEFRWKTTNSPQILAPANLKACRPL
jgi:hypothetical protein